MTGRFALALAWVFAFDLLAGAAAAQAQVVCRPDALGNVTCDGEAAPRVRIRPPFRKGAEGLGAVQPRPNPDAIGPSLAPAPRADALGNIRPSPRDLRGGGVRPPCRTDPLGNLRCP